MRHDPARDRRNRHIGRQSRILTITPGAHAGALADLTNCCAIQLKGGPDTRRSVFRQAQPGSLDHRILIKPRQAQFQFTAQPEQSLEVFAPVDAVEITGQTAQAPQVQTVVREQSVDRPDTRFFTQTGSPEQTATLRDQIGDPLYGLKGCGEGHHPAQLVHQPGPLALQ